MYIYIEVMKNERKNNNKTKLKATYEEATKFLKVHETKIDNIKKLTMHLDTEYCKLQFDNFS